LEKLESLIPKYNVALLYTLSKLEEERKNILYESFQLGSGFEMNGLLSCIPAIRPASADSQLANKSNTFEQINGSHSILAPASNEINYSVLVSM